MNASLGEVSDIVAIAESIKRSDQDTVELYLENVLSELENSDIDPNDVLPADGEAGLGFSFGRIDDPRSFWHAILVSTQQVLCTADGARARAIVERGFAGGGPALLAAIMAAFGLAPLAIGIAVVIAGIISAIGLGALCQWIATNLALV